MACTGPQEAPRGQGRSSFTGVQGPWGHSCLGTLPKVPARLPVLSPASLFCLSLVFPPAQWAQHPLPSSPSLQGTLGRPGGLPSSCPVTTIATGSGKILNIVDWKIRDDRSSGRLAAGGAGRGPSQALVSGASPWLEGPWSRGTSWEPACRAPFWPGQSPCHSLIRHGSSRNPGRQVLRPPVCKGENRGSERASALAEATQLRGDRAGT